MKSMLKFIIEFMVLQACKNQLIKHANKSLQKLLKAWNKHKQKKTYKT